jgi:TetR/AcrR family transcriptional regulator of autoinduction and epiphytic fitness
MPETQAEEAPQRRHAPGEDPAKRAQILAGAGRVIGRMGYDAASVNDIAREAGVSKGTIYAYFDDKLDLFEALMDEARDRLFEAVGSELELPGPVEERLYHYGKALARTLCCDHVVRAHRVTIGVTERMPDLGQRFYERGAVRGGRILGDFLRARIAAGELEIPDLSLATAQFVELCLAGIFRRRLLADLPHPPSEEDLHRTVHGAVDLFLCRYRKA